MRKLFLIILLISAVNVSCQTFEETASWISDNNEGSEQVIYQKDANLIHFLSVRQDKYSLTTFVNAFNPKSVMSIMILKDKYKRSLISLKFKSGGATVSKLMLNEKKERIGDATSIVMYGFDIYLDYDSEMLEKFKKAYIHLFKELGVTVKDGNLF